jgi:hypothetical protein
LNNEIRDFLKSLFYNTLIWEEI